MTACVGNLFYLAPEIFKGEPYDTKADVFSYSILAWEVVERLRPHAEFQPQKAAFETAINNRRPKFTTNSFLNEIIIKGWNESPFLRPDFSQICPYLTPQTEIGANDSLSLLSQFQQLPTTIDLYSTLDAYSLSPYDSIPTNRSSRHLTVNTISSIDMAHVATVLQRFLLIRPTIEQLQERGILDSVPTETTTRFKRFFSQVVLATK